MTSRINEWEFCGCGCLLLTDNAKAFGECENCQLKAVREINRDLGGEE